MHPIRYLHQKAHSVWFQIRTPGRRVRLSNWVFRQPFILNRFKVGVAVAAGLFTVVSFNHQVAAQASASRHDQCIARVDGRADLRAVLLYVVDLSDILPLSNFAADYTERRIAYINASFPAISPADC